MKRVIIINLIVPFLNVVFYVLTFHKLLSIKYRQFFFDYGGLFALAQLIVLIITFFVWKEKKYRLIAVLIFVTYILLGFLSTYLFPSFDLYD